MAQSGYVKGSDVLLSIGAKAIGHCTSHTCTYNTETKEVAVKPPASVLASAAGLFKSKRVTGLSVQIKSDGMKFYNDTELSFKDALGHWKTGQSVAVKCFERENDSNPYLSGNFIISSIEDSNSAGEDATYSITLDNDGVVDIDPTKLDLLSAVSA